MVTKIRLKRLGAKREPTYRIVVMDSRVKRQGRYKECVGNYYPMLKSDNEDRVKLNVERIQYWLGVGALPTERVARFIKRANIVAGNKVDRYIEKLLLHLK